MRLKTSNILLLAIGTDRRVSIVYGFVGIVWLSGVKWLHLSDLENRTFRVIYDLGEPGPSMEIVLRN